jgi:hypothetical protein
MITPAEAGGHENGDSAQFNHRVIDPAQLSRFRVECKHAIEPSCNVQGSIYQNRSWLQAAALLAVGAVGNIAHMNGPGDLQRRYILSIDLRQRRIPYAAHVSTVKRPIVTRFAGVTPRLRHSRWCAYADPGKNACEEELSLLRHESECPG